jgi:hypothetical protein
MDGSADAEKILQKRFGADGPKDGGGAGFHCEMRVYPDAGLASVIMANRTSLNTNRLLSRLDRGFISGPD